MHSVVISGAGLWTPEEFVTNEVATLHMGPDCIVVAASADCVSDISSDELEAAVTEINGAIKSVDDRIKRVFVEAEPPENHTLERTSS